MGDLRKLIESQVNQLLNPDQQKENKKEESEEQDEME